MKTKYTDELEFIRKRHAGLLRPRDIVAYAERSDTALHSYFEWDDDKAAYEYRLEQARRLIRIHVCLLPNDNKTIRVYASLPSDQKKSGGGYRTIVNILNHAERREEMLKYILDELIRVKNKYEHFYELKNIWIEIDKAKEKRKDVMTA